MSKRTRYYVWVIFFALLLGGFACKHSLYFRANFPALWSRH
ncbi:hypothetical protein [Spirosoma agri]|nr:hypothetical protein [Spirosoma agri]